MQNPWEALPVNGPEFVLADDKAAIAPWATSASNSNRVDLSLIPEPFLGNPDAEVVLLNLNPGWSAADRQWHDDPAFRKLSFGNLWHRPSEYPFYLLHPCIGQSPGAMWWRRRLKYLIGAIGREVIAANVLCVEFFPYHSRHFDKRLRVGSQEYSRMLVKNAMEANRLVVGMRGRTLWEEAVPTLRTYGRITWLNSPQNVCVTAKNCRKYHEIVGMLDRATVARSA